MEFGKMMGDITNITMKNANSAIRGTPKNEVPLQDRGSVMGSNSQIGSDGLAGLATQQGVIGTKFGNKQNAFGTISENLRNSLMLGNANNLAAQQGVNKLNGETTGNGNTQQILGGFELI